MIYNREFDLPLLTSKFLKYLTRCNYSEETIIAYKTDLKVFSQFIYEEYDGQILFDQLTRNDILDYLTYLKNEKMYALNSVYRHLSTLKSFNRFIVDELNMLENVAAKVKHQKVYTPLPPILSVEEVQALLATAKEYSFYFYVLFSLLYYTGSRITAACKLEKKDINLKEKTIYFRKVKGGKDLYLPIHDKLCVILEEFLENHPAKPYPFVFHSPTNPSMHLDPQLARKHIKVIAEQAGIEKRVNPHLLRHCLATHLTLAGVDQKFISEVLGQDDPRSTARYQQLKVDELSIKINLIP